jgi:hypothetical protein
MNIKHISWKVSSLIPPLAGIIIASVVLIALIISRIYIGEFNQSITLWDIGIAIVLALIICWLLQKLR